VKGSDSAKTPTGFGRRAWRKGPVNLGRGYSRLEQLGGRNGWVGRGGKTPNWGGEMSGIKGGKGDVGSEALGGGIGGGGKK